MLVTAFTLGFFAWYIFIGLIIAVLGIIIYLGKRTLDEIED
jgi:hypothetical protein